ncbi:MAG TPA: glycosyl transferase, partial [Nitrospirae bacterium]|nr:glycosyl transferase [Nitrospirota bacterium]
MSDFYQTGVISTFHKLGVLNLDKLEAELIWHSQDRPIALVLPSLFSEIEGEALNLIIKELKEVRYIAEVVVTLGPCSREEFQQARDFFSVLPQKTTLIWNNGEKVSDVYRDIEEARLPLGE